MQDRVRDRGPRHMGSPGALDPNSPNEFRYPRGPTASQWEPDWMQLGDCFHVWKLVLPVMITTSTSTVLRLCRSDCFLHLQIRDSHFIVSRDLLLRLPRQHILP